MGPRKKVLRNLEQTKQAGTNRSVHVLSQNEYFTLIIQIANTILNQRISLCLYKIGHNKDNNMP